MSAYQAILSKEFLEKYQKVKPAHGNECMRNVLLYRSFSREKPDGNLENWKEVITRVVNGCFNTIAEQGVMPPEEMKEKAERMFGHFYHMKALPSGRNLFAMNTPVTKNKHLYESLNNCSFFSTEIMDLSPVGPFRLIKEFLMLGVGVGADLKGAGKCRSVHPKLDGPTAARVMAEMGWKSVEEIDMTRFFLVHEEKEMIHAIRVFHDEINAHETNPQNQPSPASSLSTSLEGIDNNPTGSASANSNQPVINNSMEEKFQVIKPLIEKWTHLYFQINRANLLPDVDYVAFLEGVMKMLEHIRQWIRLAVRSLSTTQCTQRDMEAFLNCLSDVIKSEMHEFQIRYLTKDRQDLLFFNVYGEQDGTKEKAGQLIQKLVASIEDEKQTALIEDELEMIFLSRIDAYLKLDRFMEWFSLWKRLILFDEKKPHQLIEEKEASGGQSENNNTMTDNTIGVDEEPTITTAETENRRMEKENQLKTLLDESIRMMRYYLTRWIGVRHQILDQAYEDDQSEVEEKAKKPRHIQAQPGTDTNVFVIPDSREGWIDAIVDHLMNQFMESIKPYPVEECQQAESMYMIDMDQHKWQEHQNKRKGCLWQFSYHQIRPYGQPLKAFGGIASGPACLIDLARSIRRILYMVPDGAPIGMRTLADLINKIGKCVSAGNIRRSAQIMFGEPEDEDFVQLKNYRLNPTRDEYGYVSNNSVFYQVGMNLEKHVKGIIHNGEPGFVNLENCRRFCRMNGIETNRNARCKGTNPCGEQPLEDGEMCNLGEIFFPYIQDEKEFLEVIESIFLYCKTVSLMPSRYPLVNEVLSRNRRLGVSLTGNMEKYCSLGEELFVRWLERGYDHIKSLDTLYSQRFGVNPSISLTTVKPSGTLSTMAGVNPACNPGFAKEFYIRRVVIENVSPILQQLIEQGYEHEPSKFTPNATVVTFPMKYSTAIPKDTEMSLEEQAHLIILMQRHWSDNCVSNTFKFNPQEVSFQEVHDFLNYLLPRVKCATVMGVNLSVYPQMPYEEITQEHYELLCRKLNLHTTNQSTHPLPSHDGDGDEVNGVQTEEIPIPYNPDLFQEPRFCDSEKCMVLG